MSASLFEQFRKNLAVQNSDEISGRYCSITKRLNKDYWEINEDYRHCLQVGSYGRNTAINGVSDLDMAFELPREVHDRFCKREGNIQSQLLNEVRDCLVALYPNTTIRAQGQVVALEFKNYRVEVLPSFVEADGSYKYPDSNNGGTWRWCRPREEIQAVQEVHDRTNRNLKHVCKMIRAWKNQHGASMSGMLIDTLCHNFFKANTQYDDKGYGSYPELMCAVFAYLGNQPEQDYWLAPGSKDRVNTKGNFQRKAKKAAVKCQEALDCDKEKAKEKLWKSVFGRAFPTTTTTADAGFNKSLAYNDTEEFIENRYPVDVQYEVKVECDVSHRGESEVRLRWLETVFPIHLGRDLRFHVTHCNVPLPYSLLWKVRNVGTMAERRGIRGQIEPDLGRLERREVTSFPGPHYVECYVIKDGVCVARDLFDVPIHSE